MFSFILSIGLGGLLGIIIYKATAFSPLWGISVGLLTSIAVQLLIGLYLRKKIKRLTNDIQTILQNGQEKLSRKVQFFQQKPTGGVATMQKLLEKDQQVFINEALLATKRLEPLFRWNFLLEKQVNTMRLQLYYQLKQFDKVDKLINKALFIDQMSIAMKLARLYVNNNPNYKKLFYKKVKNFKKDDATILYAAYSWMLVKENKIDEAIKVLKKGKEVTGNEILTRNWENLVNGKTKNFSNTGLGDTWYALHLEEVKLPKPKMVRTRPF